MTRNWILRGVCLALATLTLGGCIILPVGRHHHPYSYR
jgi:hypothetical protein